MKLEFQTLTDIAADTTLDDGDLVKDVDDPNFCITVGALRCAQAIDAEQRRAWEREIGRRIGAAATIIAVNDNLGTGTFKTLGPHGLPTSKPFTFSGSVILTPAFAGTVNAGGPLKGEVGKVTPAPDPYQKELAALRAASATPETTFEDSLKADRMRDLAAEHRRLDAHVDAHRAETLRTAAGRQSYPPPNPYEGGIKQLRERDARAKEAK
jgi:hypothetical protein